MTNITALTLHVAALGADLLYTLSFIPPIFAKCACFPVDDTASVSEHLQAGCGGRTVGKRAQSCY